MAATIFISYGRADMQPVSWIERLRLYLAQNRHDGGLEIWDDSKIASGTDWRQSIGTAIEHCDAAILLVGPGFLASQFVMTSELPRLLSAAQTRGLRIFPLIVGYSAFKKSVLEPFNAVNNPDEPLESMTFAEQNRVLNSLAIAVTEAIGPIVHRRAPSNTAGRDRIAVVQEIQRQLGDTATNFGAQTRRRNELVQMLEERLRTKMTLEYEKLFFRYFDQLTHDERFVFDQIRAITEGALYGGNRKILELLETYPKLTGEIPELLDLRQHLVFWVNKYERVFVNQPRMCLLYVGVEDGVPFPRNVEAAIDEWLRQQTD
jgi:hypothetical protein